MCGVGGRRTYVGRFGAEFGGPNMSLHSRHGDPDAVFSSLESELVCVVSGRRTLWSWVWWPQHPYIPGTATPTRFLVRSSDLES